ncbi:hypothetical protein HNR46_003638 [Haloferula luteola]|uniref:Uncharacterized protein n=1 Tax=Haloferula luteola TaxID=595692 RepID=A0A840VL59_9BACT|nr:hypothetical protein [Haloferula luteola]MBB5353381.1 hypothetical protein [Haloferula luteola]
MSSKTEAAPRRRRRSHYYWWLLANIVAACLAVLSWLLTLHIFGHPEIPEFYRLIQKLGRAEPPVDFKVEDAPPGESADPRKLYVRYAELPDDRTATLNQALMRNYLTGLKQLELIQYVEGSFEVVETRPLGEDDLFTEGFAVRGRAMVKPDEFTKPVPYPVVIDYLFPTHRVVAEKWFAPGDRLKVSKIPDCAMLLHVGRAIDDDTPLVVLTVVPIVMNEYQVGEGRRFTLNSPEALHPGAPLPVFNTGPQP